MEIWLVLIGQKGGWWVHSVHGTQESAAAFRACKEHDGDDTSVAIIRRDEVDEVVRLAEASTNKED